MQTEVRKRKDKGHCIMIKGSIQRKDITLVNIYALNAGVPKHKTNIDIKEEMDSNIVTVGDFGTPLTSIDWSSRQKNQ